MLPDLNFFRKGGYYSRVLIVIILMVDIWAFLCAFKIVELYNPHINTHTFGAYAFISTLAWIITAGCYQLFVYHKIKTPQTIFNSHLEALPLLTLLQGSTFSIFLTDINAVMPILALNCYGIAFTIAAKVALLLLYKLWRQRYKTRYIIVGYSPAGHRLHQYLQQYKGFGYQFLGFFDNRYHNSQVAQGSVKDVYEFCVRNNVHQLYLATHHSPDLIKSLSAFADDHFIHFGYVVERHPLHEEWVLQSKTQTVPLPTLNFNYQTYYL